VYSTIDDIAHDPDNSIQIVLCTHSLTMIDRAPAKNINLLRIEDGCTTIERLKIKNKEEEGNEVEQFLGDLAQQLGITNTVMFYERCFVLIEGETEENALPIIYHNLFGRTLLEDGIRLINLKGNGAAGEFLRLLGQNRQQLTIAFLDQDTNEADRGQRAKLTEDAFKQAGFPSDFIGERIIYVGKKEFEDAFTDNVLVKALQQGYPRDEKDWLQEDIVEIRGENKFSSAIQGLVHKYKYAANSPGKFGKPEFGKYLGRACTCRADVPDKIIMLFELARKVARC
jgi:predicted ATP-dependent endonuclease of OLD family